MKIRVLSIIALCLLLGCQQKDKRPAGPEGFNTTEYQQIRANPSPPRDLQEDSLVQKGIEIAMEGQKWLGFHLMRELQENGPLSALAFCNLQAIPLTDSVARKYNVRIQRVSDRYRNPENAANAKEKELITGFQQEITAGKVPQPVVEIRSDRSFFYYPLVTNTLCLQCHGKPADMEKPVQDQIMRLYPQDLATGYSENEVRGAWKIQFEN